MQYREFIELSGSFYPPLTMLQTANRQKSASVIRDGNNEFKTQVTQTESTNVR